MAGKRISEPLRGAFIAMAAAAIGAGGTLAGNSLAGANARDQLAAQIEHEDNVRQDDLRRDAYQEFISAASQYQIDLRVVAQIAAAQQRPSTEKDLRDITNDSAQIQIVWSKIEVVGSAKAADLAGGIRKALDDIAEGGLTPDEIETRAVQIFPMLDRFVEAVRDELNK